MCSRLGQLKDLGRWKPADDLMLISAIQQTNDLAAVHLGVKFSCRFTLKEVQERWYALLYDPQISKSVSLVTAGGVFSVVGVWPCGHVRIAIEAMKALPPGVVTMALNNALWSVRGRGSAGQNTICEGQRGRLWADTVG